MTFEKSYTPLKRTQPVAVMARQEARMVSSTSSSRNGGPGAGTNPEQLFAAGWSACFIGALGGAARQMNLKLPAETAIDAEVDLGKTGDAYAIAARLNVSLRGMDRAEAQKLVDAAHAMCPYSKATRGNIEAVVKLV